MPKNRLQHFVVTSCVLLVPFALGGCVPVVPLLGVAVRNMRQPSVGDSSSQPFDTGNQSLRSLSSRADKPDLRQTALSTPDQNQLAQLKAAQKVAAQWAQQTLSGANKPLPSGPGIVIGEPQLSSTRSAELGDFGAGCARWLQLTVGGQGALGKTPAWGRVGDTRDELQKADCRWTKTDLPLVAQNTGATHLALGTITGTSASCTLSYQMWDARSNKAASSKATSAKAVGTPLVIKGTREQIVAQLPKMAQMLSARLLSSTRLSPSAPIAAPSVSSDDLQFLGRVPWKSDDQLLPEQEVRLRALSKKTALAGVLWMYNAARGWDEKALWREVANDMSAQAPSNTLVLATMARRVAGIFALHSSLLVQARAKFPNNAALLSAQWGWQNSEGQIAASTKTALQQVAAAPESTTAWRDLADSYGAQAESIRESKYYAQMTAEEQARVEDIYPQQFLAGLQAALVAPRSALAWLKLSDSATFVSAPGIADLALWKSLSLNPNDRNAYGWGLQIYQPKWFDDPAKLHRVATLLLRKPILYSQLTDAVYQAFEKTDGSQNQVSAMTDKSIAALQAASKLQPRQVAYHRALGNMLKRQKRFAEAVIEYSTWMKLQPDSAIPVSNLADLYQNSLKDLVKAEDMYRQAVVIDPQNATAVDHLADFYADTQLDFNRSEPLYQRAMKLDPENAAPVISLGDIYWFLKNDEKTGGKYYVQATKMKHNNGAANVSYAWALMKHGKREQAIIEAKKGLALGYTDNPVFKELGLQ